MLCDKINMGDGLANTIIETMSSYLVRNHNQVMFYLTVVRDI